MNAPRIVPLFVTLDDRLSLLGHQTDCGVRTRRHRGGDRCLPVPKPPRTRRLPPACAWRAPAPGSIGACIAARTWLASSLIAGAKPARAGRSSSLPPCPCRSGGGRGRGAVARSRERAPAAIVPPRKSRVVAGQHAVGGGSGWYAAGPSGRLRALAYRAARSPPSLPSPRGGPVGGGIGRQGGPPCRA